MARYTIIATTLLFGTGALAAYDKFHYATEASQWTCPGMVWQCVAPSICAHDRVIDAYHCCDTDAEDAVCWNGPSTCAGDDKTPGSNQIGCSSGATAFCCLKQREECTQRFNQINVCWETVTDPFRNVSQAKMNETFSSLSAANPSASTLAVVDIAVLTGTPKPTPSSISPSSTSPSASPSTTQTSSARRFLQSSRSSTSTQTPTASSLGSTPSTASPSPEPSNGVSGGTIGGAVGGSLAGVALIGGIFFLMRRRRGSKSATPDANELDSPTSDASELDSPTSTNAYLSNHMFRHTVLHEKAGHEVAVQAHTSYPPQELSADNYLVEMPGTEVAEKVPRL